MDELSLNDCLIILRQRKLAFLAVFAMIFTGALITAALWSNYRSTAMVEIEQSQIAPEMTTPLGMNPNDNPESLADLRINRIEQKVTAQNSLIDIITKYDLYNDMRANKPMAVLADTMTKNIKLKLISSEIANPNATQKVSAHELSAIAFTISFDYKDPIVAQKVTNELVTRFVDEDLKDRRAQSDVTSGFLEKQISNLEATLAEQEKKIADFEAANGISRPEVLMFNQQAAANAAMSLQSIDSQIATNEGTQGSLRAQLATVEPYSRVIAGGQVLTTPVIQLKALKAQYTTMTAQYGESYPDVVKLKHQIEALEASTGSSDEADTASIKSQIADVKANLKAAQKSEGSDNPDIISLKRQLDRLKSALASARQTHTSNNFHQDADNPAYIELLAQLHSAEEQHKSLVEQREKLYDVEQKYQKAVMQNPVLQQQMAALTRDYDNAKLRYRDLKEKMMAADMDKQMIDDHHGQRLLVISPPDLPQHTQPRQILIVAAGFVFALMGGLLAVIIQQMMAQSIIGARHLTSLVGVAPLVTVPYLPKDSGNNRNFFDILRSSKRIQFQQQDRARLSAGGKF